MKCVTVAESGDPYVAASQIGHGDEPAANCIYTESLAVADRVSDARDDVGW
jgi:hypothetical protein